MRLRLVLVLWALIMLLLVGLSPAAEQKTIVTVNSANRPVIMGMAPFRVDIRVKIENITEDWYCPEIEVTWADNTHSKRGGDCDPFDEIEERDFRSDPISMWLAEGLHVIEIRLRQGAKKMFRDVKVEVR